MNRQPSPFSLSSILRIAVAGAFCVGAVFALAGLPGFRPAPEPEQREQQPAAPRIEMRAAPAALAAYSYYPEQLAALQSLSAFKPIADAGRQPEAPPQPVALAVAVAAKSAGAETRPIRRPDAPAKLVAVPPVAAPVAPAAAPVPESPRFLGLPLASAAEIGNRVAGLRDTMANWGQAAASLGGRIASLWR